MQMTKAQIADYKLVRPKDKKFTLTDLSKYLNAADMMPHYVSWGGEVNAAHFHNNMLKQWNKDILCFCRWTKSLNLTAAFRRFFQKTGLELTAYRFCSIGHYNFIIIFKREQVFRFSLFCCCLSVVFQG